LTCIVRTAIIGLVFASLVVGAACSSFSEKSTNRSPLIEQVNVEHPVLYPLGNTRIECIASSAQNDKLTYNWVSNDGKIIGDGAQIIWEAPAAYGNYYIMVTVDDGSGNIVNKITTVTVIVRESTKPFCASCPK